MGTKVVIVGSRGRIGSALVRRLGRVPGMTVEAHDRRSLPLQEPEKILHLLGNEPFDILINAAAVTGVDICEEQPALARTVNALAPQALAVICRERGARMIHISTDYVFDGASPGLKSEQDPPNPLGVYGSSKWEGERLVLGVSETNLVIRTSWVFGSEHPSFPDMILERALAGEKVEAIADKWSSPCYSWDFAEWTEALLGVDGVPAISGILHLCNAGSCTWREYGQKTLDIAAEIGLPLATREVGGIELASMVRFRARRPVHSAMSCGRFTRLTGISPRPWQSALKEYLVGKFSVNNPPAE